MSSLASLATPLRTLLTTTADAVLRECGAVKRTRKVSSAVLAQTLILGWLAMPHASLSQLVHLAALRDVRITPQALDQRFTEALATSLAQLLGRAVQAAIVTGEPSSIPLLRRFSGVYVLDTTTIALPPEAAEVWPGAGGHGTAGRAALKVGVRLDLVGGGLEGPLLQPGRAQDRASPLQEEPLPTGSLRLADLGFFTLATLRRIGDAASFWLTRLRHDVVVVDQQGERIDDLTTWLAGAAGPDGVVDAWITLGVRERLPARLVAWRVPQEVGDGRRRRARRHAQRQGRTPRADRLARDDWTILVTNVTGERADVDELRVLGRARWQIEMLFKCWKQHGALAVSRSTKPWRVVAEVYAKLIGCLISHWLLVAGGWTIDTSLMQAVQAVRDRIILVVEALDRPRALRHALARIGDTLSARCSRTTRRKRPNACQILRDPALGGVA